MYLIQIVLSEWKHYNYMIIVLMLIVFVARFPCIKIDRIIDQSTGVRSAGFLSGGFTTMVVINPPEKKLAKRTSVQRGSTESTIVVMNGELFNRFHSMVAW